MASQKTTQWGLPTDRQVTVYSRPPTARGLLIMGLWEMTGRSAGSKLARPMSTATELTRASRIKSFRCLTPLPVSTLICSLRT